MTLTSTPSAIPSNIYNWQHISLAPSSSSTSSSLSTTSDLTTIFSSNLPGQQEVWRHIDNYTVSKLLKKKNPSNSDHETKELTSLFVDKSSKNKTILSGALLPNRYHSSYAPINIETQVINYAIDFGHSPSDENRGFWLLSKDNIWYKLENPNLDYSYIADESLVLCNQYLNFFDAVVYGVGGAKGLATFNTLTSKYDCRFTIEEVYENSQYNFDINILRMYCHFFYDRSLAIFEIECKLMKDFQVIKLL